MSDIERSVSHHKESEKRIEFFCEWEKRSGSGATYKALICALLKIYCTEDAESVCKLLQKKPGTYV